MFYIELLDIEINATAAKWIIQNVVKMWSRPPEKPYIFGIF